MADTTILRELERVPVRSAGDLNTLNDDEVFEGYQDGRENFPCGENRSRSYWHGWRNGQVDGGHAEKDGAQKALVRALIAQNDEGRET